MARKSKTPSSILVLSPKIEAAIIKGLAPETAISSAEFIDVIEHRDHGGLHWAFPEFQEIEARLDSGDTEGALLAAMTAIGKMSRQNHMLTLAIAADKRAISAETAQKELKRRDGNHKHVIARQTIGSDKANLARQLWPQYEPLVKSKEIKAKVACKRIGEAIKDALKLDAPVPAETVRDYLKRKSCGGG